MTDPTSAQVKTEPITIPVSSGGALTGTLRTPVGGTPRRAVVVHPATAVPERLYSGFAEYLAADSAVLTYTYRGVGHRKVARGARGIRMRDWMDTDVPAAANWMQERFDAMPQLAVGHSIGGHALSLGSGSAELAGFATVASHAGVTATIPDRGERARVGLILRVVGPASAHTLGYLPGRRLGLGEDMPGAAVLEWGRWSRLPRYFFDDPTMHAEARAHDVTGTVLAIGFSDDPWATPGQIDAITQQLRRAEVERRTYSPAEAGVDKIGHMGFFRRGAGAALWPQLRDWLVERSA